MPNIKANAHAFANATVPEEILNAVNAATPAGVKPKAEVVRDASGKVVEVIVNLPFDISKADLANAKAAIDENAGISKSVAMPIGGGPIETFDGDTPGTLIADSNTTTLRTISDVVVGLRGGPTPANGEFVSAQAVDSFGGAGSALELRDDDTTTSKTFHVARGNLDIVAVNNGLTQVGGLRFACDVKLVDHSFNGDHGVNRTVFFLRDDVSKEVILEYDPVAYSGSQNWFLRTSNTGNAGAVDTGISAFAFIHAEFKMGLDGILSVTANALTLSINIGYVPFKTEVSMWGTVVDLFTASQAGQQKSIIMDNMDIEILSGI